MKTPEQIKEWLEEQEWYPQFRLNTHCDNSVRSAEKVFNGNCLKGTILLSFDWRKTEEGFDFWNVIDKQFQEWYNKEETK